MEHGKTNKKKKLFCYILLPVLLWISVSAPYYTLRTQSLKKNCLSEAESCHKINSLQNMDFDSDFSGKGEENKMSSLGNGEEDFLWDQKTSSITCKNSGLLLIQKQSSTYLAYHGELLVPPPNNRIG
ncbi:MAG: hypothetical protein N2747_10755 [Chitinophagaceae bacterium]|nr:hypothetical protein [Chitinophagaceae bacterium]